MDKYYFYTGVVSPIRKDYFFSGVMVAPSPSVAFRKIVERLLKNEGIEEKDIYIKTLRNLD
jgi:hypothetical protein